MATLASYTLATLRNRLADEFGLQATGSDRQMIDSKINQAIHWIVRRRPQWPWLRKSLVINVTPSVTGTGTFTQASATMVVTAGTDPAAYMVVDNSSVSGDLTEGYLVTAFSSPNATLEAQYTGTTGSYSYTAAYAFFRLPDDFKTMIKLHTSELIDRGISWASPDTFERIRRGQIVLSMGTSFAYSVVPDPLGASTGALYLALYPYPADRQTLRGLYYAHVQDLEDDTDVPIIPYNDRLAIFHVACWLLCQQKKHDRVVLSGYAALANEAVERMVAEANTFEEDSDQLLMKRRGGVLGWDPDFDYPVA